MIDRIEPTRRPADPPQGYHQWRSLVFLHWPVPISQLRPLVPNNLELDLFDDVAYVGIVPFWMQGVRPRWWPSRSGLQFLETNVRTYVVHRGRPGIYFFSLDAASRIAVWTARRFWGLPYFNASMTSERAGSEILYDSVRAAGGPRHRVRCRIDEPLGVLNPASLEFFLLERYLMFVEGRGDLLSGQVHHTPYPVHGAQVLELTDELLAAADVHAGQIEPTLAHYATGVDVEVFALKRLGTG